ncbi:hypothetical protein OC844_001755 [Tilletia horrida]|nr:hypothetical protein OC844_001755 [Tilletia horrida]
MGIQGLLPLLKDIQTSTHIREYKGKTLGVDAYVWLHRGAYACAQELVLGQPTDKFIRYAMHKINMLRHFGVTPYLVFDGGKLPSKKRTEDDRERRRSENRGKAEECLAAGQKDQARDLFAKCLDISPAIAYQLIKALRREKIPYIVAPYEADAQLAYMEKEGIIDGIITEDSDMLVFGCQRVLFKLESDGSCIEILQSRFTANKTVSFIGWTIQEFRHMSILSGCDYLDSITGMGLKVAHRLLRRYKTVDKVLQAVRLEGKLRVPPTYARDFRRAELTFIHQRVIDPRTRTLTTIAPIPAGVDESAMDFIGPVIPSQHVAGIANGDIDPITLSPVEDIMPSASQAASSAKPRGGAFTSAASSKTATPDPRQRSLTTFYKALPTPTPAPKVGRTLLSVTLGTASQPAPARATPLKPRDVNRGPPSPPATLARPGTALTSQKRGAAFATQQPAALARRLDAKGKAREVDTSSIGTTSRFFQLNGGVSPEAARQARLQADEDMDALDAVSSAAGSSPAKGGEQYVSRMRKSGRKGSGIDLSNFLHRASSLSDCDDLSSTGSLRPRKRQRRGSHAEENDAEDVEEPQSSPIVRQSPRTAIREQQKARAAQSLHRPGMGTSPASHVTSSPSTSPIRAEPGWEDDNDSTPTALRRKDVRRDSPSESAEDLVFDSQASSKGQARMAEPDHGDADEPAVEAPAVSFSQLDRHTSSQFGRASPHESQLGDDWATQVLVSATQETELVSEPSDGSPDVYLPRRVSSSPKEDDMESSVSPTYHRQSSRARSGEAVRKRPAAAFDELEADDVVHGLAYVVKDERALNGPFGELGFASQQQPFPSRSASAGRSSAAAPQLRPISRAVHRTSSGPSLRSVGEHARRQGAQLPTPLNAPIGAEERQGQMSETRRPRIGLDSTQLKTPLRRAEGEAGAGSASRSRSSRSRTPLQPLNLSMFMHAE